jgi:hypothetical protein
MNSVEGLIADLALFADLGTEPPIVSDFAGKTLIRFSREGHDIELLVSSGGKIIERAEGEERQHANVRALFASPRFGNLARWAESQKTLLKNKVESESIKVVGERSIDGRSGDALFFDESLVERGRSRRTLVAILDGPAGIGKTSFIRTLSYHRAKNFRTNQRPLILHVESRGRVLQNVTDLIAFSLQTLRLNVTYDQIPALVKRGLVTLAVDGFDELGDPNGYELAWAQVNDLIASVRGSGSIILSGRDTFLGHERMATALNAIDVTADELFTFTLRPLSVNVAKDWLRSKNWSEFHLAAAQTQPLFEEGSYALRPFFLSELARDGVADRIVGGEIRDLLSFLVNAMIEREASKFGRDVEVVSSETGRKRYVGRFMEEVARDLADNQTASIALETLSWLAEAVADENMPTSVKGILKNRAGVIAFLRDDDRRGYKAFIHEKVYDYFLAITTFKAISNKEMPKYLRRNIFGRDFLETFAENVRDKSTEDIAAFLDGIKFNLSSLGYQDRGRGNIAALALAACSTATILEVPNISDAVIDEAFLSETVSPIRLSKVSIGQLYGRSADLRAVEFTDECHIYSLVADDGTIPSKSLPLPATVELGDMSLRNPDDIGKWLRRQFHSANPNFRRDIAATLSNLGPFELLARLVRYKPFWLKDCDDRSARRILDDPNWEMLRDLLLKHDLLVERTDVPSGGRPGHFYHVRDKGAFMDLTDPAEKLAPFLLELLEESLK